MNICNSAGDTCICACAYTKACACTLLFNSLRA